jgi:hypothetical protein
MQARTIRSQAIWLFLEFAFDFFAVAKTVRKPEPDFRQKSRAPHW